MGGVDLSTHIYRPCAKKAAGVTLSLMCLDAPIASHIRELYEPWKYLGRYLLYT